ncbi:MAG: hypothetical protein IJT40_04140 [Firmicutes bacterium]|nr:hypothetical protein [Bacillota bacterium]
MTINSFLSEHYLHDSLVEKVTYESNTVDLIIDFCFWMQDGYRENEPETGIIHLHFPDVTSFSGPSGPIDDYSILEADYLDDCFTLLLMDDFNNTSYELKITSASGIVEVNH